MWTIIYRHVWKRLFFDLLAWAAVTIMFGYAFWLVIAHIAGE